VTIPVEVRGSPTLDECQRVWVYLGQETALARIREGFFADDVRTLILQPDGAQQLWAEGHVAAPTVNQILTEARRLNYVHEAGHAVVALVLGDELEQHPAATRGGVCRRRGYADHSESADALRNAVAAACAGIAAEHLIVNGREPTLADWNRRWDQSDLADARRGLAGHMAGEPSRLRVAEVVLSEMEAAQSRAVRLVCELRPVIERVADAFQEQPELSLIELREIVRSVD
jgi:hypothetical protein